MSVADQAGARLTGPDQGRWFRVLDADRANLWRAAQYAAGAPGGTSRVLRLSAVLRRYWISRPLGEAMAELVRPVLQRPEARSDHRLFVDAAITVMDAARGPDVQAALEFGDRIVAEARQVGELGLLIEALSVHCGRYYFAGAPENGAVFGAEAVALARRAGDDVLLGSSIMGYLLCLDVTDSDAAGQLYAEAIACTRRSGNRLIAHVLHNNAGVRALRAGDVAAARAHLVQAEQAGAEIGERSHVVPVNMGWVLRQEHDPQAAQATFQGGMRLSRRTGDRYGVAYCARAVAGSRGPVPGGQHRRCPASSWRRAVRRGVRPRADAELRRRHRAGAQRSTAGRCLTGRSGRVPVVRGRPGGHRVSARATSRPARAGRP
jgi:hypothetical protein